MATNSEILKQFEEDEDNTQDIKEAVFTVTVRMDISSDIPADLDLSNLKESALLDFVKRRLQSADDDGALELVYDAEDNGVEIESVQVW